MVEVTIRPVTRDALAHLAKHMRPADRQEVWAAGHRTPREALNRAVDLSRRAWLGYADGVPAAAWGVAPASLLGETGVPWLLGTEAIERHPVAFLRRCRGMLDDLSRDFLVLRNLVDTRNRSSIRWLGWLGFAIDPPIPHGPDRLPFHPFWRQADV